MKLKQGIIIVFLWISIVGMAQTSNNKIAVSLNLKKSEYNGDYGNGILDFGRKSFMGSGIVIGYYLNSTFDFGLQTGYGDYGYKKDAVNYFSGRKLDASLYTHFKFDNGYILKETSRFTPFLSLGLGFASYSINKTTDKSYIIPGLVPTIVTQGVDFIVPVGVGLKCKLSDRLALQYQYLYSITNADNHDENRGSGLALYSSKAGNDAYGEHLLSIVFAFGKGKDSDRDGVPDRKDKCSNTPLNVPVDKAGCPLDTDNDGVFDYLDKCNDTPAGVKVDKNGCPIDTDKDGVPDYQDRCPDVKGLPAFWGCPDSDGDGVPDKEDKCPALAGDPNCHGCPDADGDGITDSEDKCPQVAGTLENDGCPELKTEEKKIFDQAIYGIQFEMGKDVIKQFSLPILNRIVIILKENTSYNLEINGYTDSLGDDVENLILSQSRANAVKAYLESSGIESSRLVATGYGEKDPVATNYTEAGRAKNRRVEFKVFF